MVGTGELLPCPFCGGEARVQHQSRELYGDVVDWYGVYCKKQFCGFVSGQSTEAEAIEAWNTRADDYRHAAEYWQRMYEEAFAERTCKRITLGLERYTTASSSTREKKTSINGVTQNQMAIAHSEKGRSYEHQLPLQNVRCESCRWRNAIILTALRLQETRRVEGHEDDP